MELAHSFSTCDSLKNEVSEYITQNQLKDSLYESHVVTLDSVIAVKDSLITVKNELYYKLKTLFNQSLTQQQSLMLDNRFLQKKLKRQKFKSKVVAIGLAIVTGLATDYLIHH